MMHLAPQHSPAHTILRTEAKKAGFPDQEIRQFLWLINAHDHLIAFVRICENLSQIIGHITSHLNESLHHLGIEWWPEITAWIVREAPALKNRIGSDFDYQPRSCTDHPVLNRGATRHGLYAALWNTHEEQACRERFQLIVAHALIAHIVLMRRYIPMEIYEEYGGQKPISGFPNSPYPMTLAIRVMSEAVAADVLLQLNPYQSAEAFAREPKYVDVVDSAGMYPDIGQKSRRQHLTNYCYFLQKVHALRGWHKRAGSGGEGSPHVPGFVGVEQLFTPQPLPTDEPHAPPGAIAVLVGDPGTANQKTAGRIRKAVNDDDDPGDNGDDSWAFFVDPHAGSTGGRAAGSVLSARGMARQIAMKNQMFAWQYDALTCQEIKNVLTGFAAVFDRLIDMPRSRGCDLRLETIALTAVVLWTGSSFERAASLKIVMEGAQSDSDLVLVLPTSSQRARWQIRSEFPAYKTTLQPPEGVTRRRSKFLIVDDVVGGSSLVQRLFASREQSTRTKIFSSTFQSYRRVFNHLVGQIRESERVTSHKWEKVLFQWVLNQGGNITDAVAITGTPHFLARSKCFYATPKIADLLALYRRTVAAIMGQCLGFVGPLPEMAVLQGDQYLGSRACALKSSIQQAVWTLQKRMVGMASYDDWDDFVEYHNWFTFYTVQMIAYGTGYRAVNTPIIRSTQLDPTLNLTAIADKEFSSRHKSRVSYVPDLVLAQMKHYEAHCGAIRALVQEHLKISDPNDFSATGFFIGSRGVEPVRPRTLAPYLEEFLPLPANSHRRFMRTELAEADCPADYIDAFMGHGSAGEEPWGKFSALSVREYIAVVERYLVPLLHELGWVPISSRLAPAGDR